MSKIIYIVTHNDGEYAHSAYLLEITEKHARNTIAKDSRAFMSLESAQDYAEKLAKKDDCPLSTKPGMGGVTIFSVEMAEQLGLANQRAT